ncbi:MAG: hypothetical protein INH13_20055 [Cupriavidus sp.]|nr:hypothetical protein [Cupriavidus sp.]
MTDRYESRASTHADNCWSWGHGHYECAVGQINRDEALLRQALYALETTARYQTCIPGAVDPAIKALRERLGEGAEP